MAQTQPFLTAPRPVESWPETSASDRLLEEADAILASLQDGAITSPEAALALLHIAADVPTDALLRELIATRQFQAARPSTSAPSPSAGSRRTRLPEAA